jgi:hypothetical protein
LLLSSSSYFWIRSLSLSLSLSSSPHRAFYDYLLSSYLSISENDGIYRGGEMRGVVGSRWWIGSRVGWEVGRGVGLGAGMDTAGRMDAA